MLYIPNAMVFFCFCQERWSDDLGSWVEEVATFAAKVFVLQDVAQSHLPNRKCMLKSLNLWRFKIRMKSSIFDRVFAVLYLAHRIKQSIPKLWCILNFHEFFNQSDFDVKNNNKQTRLVKHVLMSLPLDQPKTNY